MWIPITPGTQPLGHLPVRPPIEMR